MGGAGVGGRLTDAGDSCCGWCYVYCVTFARAVHVVGCNVSGLSRQSQFKVGPCRSRLA